jgi:hypothetical protein
MADASQAFTVVINPGSTNLSPVGFDFHLGLCIVRRILVTWPPGCGGLVGVQLTTTQSGSFPIGKFTYFVFDDYTYAFDVDNQSDTGSWGMLGYNTDATQHGIQFVFEYDYLRGHAPSTANQPIAL